MRFIIGFLAAVVMSGVVAFSIVGGAQALKLGEVCGSAQRDDGSYEIMVGVQSQKLDGTEVMACGIPHADDPTNPKENDGQGESTAQHVQTEQEARDIVNTPTPDLGPTPPPTRTPVPPPTATPLPVNYQQHLDGDCLTHVHANDGYTCIKAKWEWAQMVRDYMDGIGNMAITSQPVRVHAHPHEGGDTGGVSHSH